MRPQYQPRNLDNPINNNNPGYSNNQEYYDNQIYKYPQGQDYYKYNSQVEGYDSKNPQVYGNNYAQQPSVQQYPPPAIQPSVQQYPSPAIQNSIQPLYYDVHQQAQRYKLHHNDQGTTTITTTTTTTTTTTSATTTMTSKEKQQRQQWQLQQPSKSSVDVEKDQVGQSGLVQKTTASPSPQQTTTTAKPVQGLDRWGCQAKCQDCASCINQFTKTSTAQLQVLKSGANGCKLRCEFPCQRCGPITPACNAIKITKPWTKKFVKICEEAWNLKKENKKKNETQTGEENEVEKDAVMNNVLISLKKEYKKKNETQTDEKNQIENDAEMNNGVIRTQ